VHAVACGLLGGLVEPRFSQTRRVAVVAPSGELDISTAAELRHALLDACEAERLVVVDLARVTFLDSSGLGLLVAASRRMRERGASLHVANAQGVPLRAIRLTNLVDVLNVHELPPTCSA
jgi:anti-anti-sigma factor